MKPLLADPDKGLQTVLNQWLNKKHGSNSNKYEPELRNMDFNGDTISKVSLDEVIRTYTPSQKKALILSVYFSQRMTYGSSNDYRGTNADYKKIYNGTFKGVCADGAKAGYDICQYLDIKSKYTGSMELDHGWCVIYVTDRNGVSYWHGIHTTSNGYNLKGTASVKNGWRAMTKKQVMAYTCKPNEQTHFVTVRKHASHKPAETATPPSVTTQAPVQTPVPQTTPAPTPKPSPTTTTVIFNTPEPPEPEETKTPVATTEPTKAPVVTQEPTPTPIVTPEPTVEPTIEPTPTPTETPVPQRIVIPHDEHGYTCPGCDVSPYRHKSKTNPYISNFTKVYGNYTVYEHNCNGTIRYFDADGNEYIDINRNSDIMDEIVTLAG